MQNRINSSMQRVAKWASLPALAIAALVAAAPAASAFDQQATDDQRDYSLSWGAATGGFGESGPYAGAFRGGPNGPAYREGRGAYRYPGYR